MTHGINKFEIHCKACGSGWILIEAGADETPTEIVIFPRMLCLDCGAAEDVRSAWKHTVPGINARYALRK